MILRSKKRMFELMFLTMGLIDDGKYYCHGRSPTRKKDRDKRCDSHRYMSRDYNNCNGH
ncbi:conserved hypothetical protein [Ricinus communis]|uniref:Uncharacterized protein n=1 Tax=Ricinus communis TaxID=3988 RepID=B9T278_RICCO|nr:conserved hypothetical protein [Ricinus communis]